MVKTISLSVVIGSLLLIGLIMASDNRKGDQSCAAIVNDNSQTTGGCGQMVDKVEKNDEEWRAKLSPEQFRITRQKGTEPAFSGKYWDHKGSGTYTCVCCGEKLFSSQTKYDSGSGWPSFWAPLSESNVNEHSDFSLAMVRTEVTCSNCGAHLGHLFDDGPRPTGQRYCINSAALDFIADDAERQE